MKMNKWFMLGMVGLAFTACSNEEEVTGSKFPAGKGAVTIKIVSPTVTKSIEAGHAANVEVVPAENSNVVITLTGTNNYEEEISLTKTEWENGQEVTFWNVEQPSKVTVKMNDGKKTYIATDLVENPALQSVENIPAYGETTKFNITDETGSPVIGNDHQAGAVNGDQNKTYQLYSATVTMAIPMARLEVSGIQHIITGDHVTGNQPGNCQYQTLTIGGVYMDNIYANGNGVSYSEADEDTPAGFSVPTGTPANYCFDTGKGVGAVAVLRDEVKAPEETNFLTADAVWPATPKVFGYNFFGASGATNLPQFKIYFSNSAPAAGQTIPAGPRYAMITKYKQTAAAGGQEITEFKPGHIYRITSAKLTDENIIGDEGGNTLYGVEVTVTEAQWEVESIEGVWQD